MLNRSPKCNESRLYLSADRQWLGDDEDLTVASKALALYAPNLNNGDEVTVYRYISPPDAACTGHELMEIVNCGCRMRLWKNSAEDMNNVLLIRLPGRYTLKYNGNRTAEDLMIIPLETTEEAGYGDIKLCCG